MILSLLDGPVGVDPAFHIVWARFRMMRGHSACCPEEEPRIFRMVDLISRGAQGHGPVHLLVTSAAEVRFAWDGDEKGWVWACFFRSMVLSCWKEKLCSFFKGMQVIERSHFGSRPFLVQAIHCSSVSLRGLSEFWFFVVNFVVAI